MALSYKDSVRNARMNLIADTTGTGLGTTAYLEIFTGSPPGKASGTFNADSGIRLASLQMSNPVASSASAGLLTFGAITSAAALAGGTPGYFRMKTAANGAASTVIVEGDAGVGSGSLNFNSALVSGGTVSITSATILEGNA